MITIARRSPSRRVLAALLGVGALALTACNPESVTPARTGLFSLAELRYTGPGPAWFEASVSGTEGYRVTTEATVWVPGTWTEQAPPRDCGSATVRGQRLPCIGYYIEPTGAFPFSESHRADLDAPGTYWPLIIAHPEDKVELHVRCYRGDPTTSPRVDCPESTKVSARTVVDPVSEKLVGDLENVSTF